VSAHGRSAAVVVLVVAMATIGCPLTATDDYALGQTVTGGAPSAGGQGQGAGTAKGGSGGAGASGGEGGGVGTGGTGLVGALVSMGLVARWTIDEAASGQMPTQLRDSAANPFDVDLQYTDTMSFSETDGHRGLSWSASGLSGGGRVPADGTKVHSAIHGSTQLTVEMVASVSNIIDSGSRFISVGTGTEWEPFAVVARTTDGIDFRMNGTDRSARWSVDLTDGARRTYHFVVDTSATNQIDRIVAFIDGGPANRVDGLSPVSGEPFDLGTGRTFLIGNREGGSRSILGTIFYMALYDRALSTNEIQSNAAVLEAVDDTPK